MLKDLLDGIKEQTRERLREDGFVAPVAIFWKDGHVGFVPLSTEEAGSKPLIAQFFRHMVCNEGVTEIIFIAESFGVECLTKEEIQQWYKEHNSIQDHPNCYELVMVVYQNKDEEICYTARMTRPKSGQPTLGEFEASNNITGLFAGIFKKSIKSRFWNPGDASIN